MADGEPARGQPEGRRIAPKGVAWGPSRAAGRPTERRLLEEGPLTQPGEHVVRASGSGLMFLAATLLALSACGAPETPPPASSPRAAGALAQSGEPMASATAWPVTTTTACPVTTPNGNRPPGERPNPFHYGNGKLWTELWPEGMVIVRDRGWIEPDGRIGIKWGWWRSHDAAGQLSISGRRLDAEAPPLEAIIPSGYGTTGFQVSGLIFSSPGCWEVTGRSGGYELTFVTEVVVPPELTSGG